MRLTMAKYKYSQLPWIPNDVIVVFASNDNPAVMETIEAYYYVIVVLTNNDNPAAMETMTS